MADAFERDIIGLLDASGALKSEASAQRLVELLSRAGDGIEKARELVLVVLRKTASHGSCLAAFVNAGGLKHLRNWLRAIQKAGFDDTGVAREILRALDVLPLDFPTLQTSEIGKPVARMSSSRGGAEKFTKDVVALADSLVAKWSKLVPDDAAVPSKKRKSTSTADPGPGTPSQAKTKRSLVSTDDAPAQGSPSLPAVLPELTSLSSLAQEALSSSSGKTKTPSPLTSSAAPSFGANGRRIVLSSPASAVTSSPDALVPGEGDPMAYGDKENGVLVNPVRQVVGGQKHVRGKRGSIRFPDKDDDLRLIRWFLRTDEPAKVADMSYQPSKGSADGSAPGDGEAKSFDRALESRSEQFHDVKDLLRSHVEIDDEGHVSAGTTARAQISVPITPRFSFPTVVAALTPCPYSRRCAPSDIPSQERTFQMERTACAFRISQSLVPVPEQIAILDPDPAYIPPDFVEYEPTDDGKCRYCNFLLENQQVALQPAPVASPGGLLPIPPPAPVPQPVAYHEYAYPERGVPPPQYYADPPYSREYYGAPAVTPAYPSYPAASSYPPSDPYGYPSHHYPPAPLADDYGRYRDSRPLDSYARPPEPVYPRDFDDRSRDTRRDAPRQPLWPSSKPQLRPASERHCIFFHSGTCRNGTACSFIHDPNHRLTAEDYPVGRR